MKDTETYHDEALRIIMRQQAEEVQKMEFPKDFADRLMQRIEQKEAQRRVVLRRKRRWLAVGIAAAIALLVGVVVHIFQQDDKMPQQVVVRKPEIKNDSIKTMKNLSSKWRKRWRYKTTPSLRKRRKR